MEGLVTLRIGRKQENSYSLEDQDKYAQKLANDAARNKKKKKKKKWRERKANEKILIK